MPTARRRISVVMTIIFVLRTKPNAVLLDLFIIILCKFYALIRKS